MNKKLYDLRIDTPFPYPADLIAVIFDRERFEQWLKDSELNFIAVYNVGDQRWEYEIETSKSDRILNIWYKAKAENGITFDSLFLSITGKNGFKACLGAALAATICAQQYDEIRYHPGRNKFPIDRLDGRGDQE